MGTETKIIKDKSTTNKLINLRPKNLQKKLINYLPEDVYYDRNRYKDREIAIKKLNYRKIFQDSNFLGQQLTFDIDPENIPCKCKSKYPKFCNICMQKAFKKGIELAEHLKQNFNKIGLVYSGRGIHVHVFDKQAFSLTIADRHKINKDLKKYHTDPWVSEGKIRLIRLPYSLNALVSRIVTPLTIKQASEFDPIKTEQTIPRFIKK